MQDVLQKIVAAVLALSSPPTANAGDVGGEDGGQAGQVFDDDLDTPLRQTSARCSCTLSFLQPRQSRIRKDFIIMSAACLTGQGSSACQNCIFHVLCPVHTAF